MATAYPNEEINITINENLITCQICMERFDSPRILPCQHTFCKKCIETIINKNCLGNHECDILHCPVCRRKCKIGKGRKDMDVIMKAFPENRLMNDLIEGMKRSETETNTVAFGYNDTESSRHPCEKVQQCLWSYHCFLLLFKQYMEAIFWIRLWKSQGQALHNAHINRKLTAMFSDIVLSIFYNNNLVKYTHEFSTPSEHTVLRHMSYNDRMREIENIQDYIRKWGGNFCDGDQHTFMADMSKSNWTQMENNKCQQTDMSKSNWTQMENNKCQQTDAESLSLFHIGFRSLGFSNLFSLTHLILLTFLQYKLWPIHFMILGKPYISQFRTVLLGTRPAFITNIDDHKET
ncbi:uncharacterized protein LOC128237973 [Mya arenaria]|uniref:uncharacterized protein LOC128237972 n=1 Tax=Mya arenaria TaxID=6604 RepID=UPI0022E8FAA4|nr:uncharacterized protein LOC128237972 [Mya arenaria]XP_052809507.1 uncharacterized protein LOC128237973 [Mya arenaria]